MADEETYKLIEQCDEDKIEAELEGLRDLIYENPACHKNMKAAQCVF